MNQRPSGYEPDELPSCSIPRYLIVFYVLLWSSLVPKLTSHKTILNRFVRQSIPRYLIYIILCIAQNKKSTPIFPTKNILRNVYGLRGFQMGGCIHRFPFFLYISGGIYNPLLFAGYSAAGQKSFQVCLYPCLEASSIALSCMGVSGR